LRFGRVMCMQSGIVQELGLLRLLQRQELLRKSRCSAFCLSITFGLGIHLISAALPTLSMYCCYTISPSISILP
jgi:hypothetical protein